MLRTVQNALLVALITAISAGSARASSWGPPWHSSGYCYPSYYYPAPVAYYYVAPPAYYCAPVIRAVPAVGPYAQPTPAPPSSNREPALKKKTLEPPKVSESQSLSISADKTVPVVVDSKGCCRVGFWNVTGREVTLIIDGQTYVVPRDRNLTLKLARQFSWRVQGREPQTERVSDDKVNHEIVVR
jgi:hypothetical protein